MIRPGHTQSVIKSEPNGVGVVRLELGGPGIDFRSGIQRNEYETAEKWYPVFPEDNDNTRCKA